ncbi:amidophosphoribosyltransferase [Micromonospora sp. DT233]|uniref:amidophosphoribosyltransferase n=1 Tax=Micromonospora sp. DT233 TaxID=3393432 RepID=UPI003CED2868
MRTAVAVLAGLAVVYFGSRGRSPDEGAGVSGGVVVLAVLAAALAWYLTRPQNDTTK